MEYEVGDIIWVVGNERPGLRVYRVVEEVTKKTLEGTLTSYRLQAPSRDGKNKLVNMDNISGEFFTNKEDVRKKLMENATAAITRMIDSADSTINRLWNKKSDIVVANQVPPKPGKETPTEENVVELPDGTRAILRTNLEDLK